MLRHLDKAAQCWSQRGWATAMRAVLLEAKAASEQAAAVGLPKVPTAIAGPIIGRYNAALDHAIAGLPPGPPPRRKHGAG